MEGGNSPSGDGMKVLHVVATMTRRGAELFTADLVRALDQTGTTQCVVVLHSPDNGPIVQFDVPVTVLGSGSWSMPGLRLSFRAAHRLKQSIRAWGPDIVQAHGGESLKYMITGGAARDTRLIYRRIGAAPGWITTGPKRFAYGSLMRRASRVVTVADSLRLETIELFGVRPEKVVTIPNGVDTARMRPANGREAIRKELGIPLHARVILSVGALTWEKNPMAHLDVSQRVFRKLPEAFHLVVGDGPLRAEVQRAARERGLDGRVRFLGSRADVPDIMAASDVLILASAVEGMPGSAIEAGMTGLPVVGFRMAGIPEVVEDGVTGVLVAPNDVDALARSTLKVLSDGSGSRSMGEAARERCLARFDIQDVAHRYLDLYREVLAL
jgi:glycosyltransferase involved in cell wall biosynthesis